MFLRRNLIGILGVILACGLVAFAQEPQPQTPTTNPQDGTYHRGGLERKGKHRDGRGRHRGMGGHRVGRFMQELNLSEEQKQQIQSIHQRRFESTKTQREELMSLREKRRAGTFTADDEVKAKALRQEIRSSMEGVRTEMDGILTAEQKARREELMKEHKAKHEQRMKERQELRNKPE